MVGIGLLFVLNFSAGFWFIVGTMLIPFGMILFLYDINRGIEES